MKARDLANVLLKVLGIYWFVQAVILLLQGSMMPFMGLQNVQGFNWKLELISMFMFVALYAVAGYFLIMRTSAVLRLMAIDKETMGSADNNLQFDYGPMAFALLGAFFAIPAFGHVLSGFIKLAAQWQEANANFGMFKQSILMNILPDMTENVAKLIIGIALILGREKLGQLWKRLRPLAANRSQEGRD